MCTNPIYGQQVKVRTGAHAARPRAVQRTGAEGEMVRTLFTTIETTLHFQMLTHTYSINDIGHFLGGEKNKKKNV